MLNTENETSDSFTIFDVYNPAFKHGGQLRIEVAGFYDEFQGYRILSHESKYWKRKNMTGVSFKSAVVVKRLVITQFKLVANLGVLGAPFKC